MGKMNVIHESKINNSRYPDVPFIVVSVDIENGDNAFLVMINSDDKYQVLDINSGRTTNRKYDTIDELWEEEFTACYKVAKSELIIKD